MCLEDFHFHASLNVFISTYYIVFIWPFLVKWTKHTKLIQAAIFLTLYWKTFLWVQHIIILSTSFQILVSIFMAAVFFSFRHVWAFSKYKRITYFCDKQQSNTHNLIFFWWWIKGFDLPSSKYLSPCEIEILYVYYTKRFFVKNTNF